MAEEERLSIWIQIRNARKAAADLAVVQKATQGFRRTVGGLGTDFQTTTKKGSRFKEAITLMRKSIIGLAGASSVFMAIGLGKKALDFESSMARVNATLQDSKGFTPERFRELQNAAMEWGEKSKFSSGEVADGIKELATIGWDSSQILAGLGGTVNLAGASQMSMAEAANTQATLINQFKLQAKDAGMVADVLSTAVNVGAAELDDLAISFQYVGPIAKDFGTNLVETTAALELMASRGYTGSKAGRALRIGFLRLVNPVASVEKGVKGLGLTFEDLQKGDGSLKALPDLLKVLKNSLKGMTKGEQQKALAQIFGTEAVSQWMVLIDQAGKPMDNMTKKLDKSQGAAKRFGKIMMDTVGGGIDEAMNSIENLAIKGLIKYQEPLKAFFNAIQGFFNDLGDSGSDLRKNIDPLLEGFGAILSIGTDIVKGAWPQILELAKMLIAPFAVLGQGLKWVAEQGQAVQLIAKSLAAALTVYIVLLFGQKSIVYGIEMLRGGLKALGWVMKQHPIVRWAMIIAALIVFFRKLYEENETFRAIVQAVGRAVKIAWDAILNAIKVAYNWIKSNWPTILAILTGPIGIAVKLILDNWNSIKAGFMRMVEKIKELWNGFVNGMKAAPGKLATLGKDIGRAIINGMIDMINAGTSKINSMLKFTIPGIGVGPVSTPSVTIDPADIPSIPHLAEGGIVREMGRVLVGERGPEMLTLPRAARVDPLPTPAFVGAGDGGGWGGPRETRIPVFIDGKQVAEAVHRHTEARKARR